MCKMVELLRGVACLYGIVPQNRSNKTLGKLFFVEHAV